MDKEKIAKIEKQIDRYSRKTSFISWVAVITTFLGATLSIYQFYIEKEAKKSNAIESQIENLDTMSKNLKDLLFFIENQKDKIVSEQQLLNKMKEERENIQPLLSADKELVDAILNAHEEKRKNSVWIDRTIGFLLGIAGSMIATLLFNFFRRRFFLNARVKP